MIGGEKLGNLAIPSSVTVRKTYAFCSKSRFPHFCKNKEGSPPSYGTELRGTREIGFLPVSLTVPGDSCGTLPTGHGKIREDRLGLRQAHSKYRPSVLGLVIRSPRTPSLSSPALVKWHDFVLLYAAICIKPLSSGVERKLHGAGATLSTVSSKGGRRVSAMRG